MCLQKFRFDSSVFISLLFVSDLQGLETQDKDKYKMLFRELTRIK